MIERVCVVGAGVIGSLYAAHLSRVADVWVLTRRPEHARALAEHGLTVTGRADFTASSTRRTIPAELPPPDVAIVATKATGLDEAATRARGPLPGRDDPHDPERPRRRADRAPPRRLAARLGRHVHERHAPRRHARRVHPRHRDLARAVQRDPVRAASRSSTALIERSGLKARAFRDLRPAQWSKLIFNATVNAVAALTASRTTRISRPRSGRPTSAISSTRSWTRARPSRRRRGSSCTRTRGR